MKRKNLVRLTEGDLHRIVRRTLNEFIGPLGGGRREEMGFEELEEIHMNASKATNSVQSLINNPKYEGVREQLMELYGALENAGDLFMEIERSLGI